MMEDTAVTSAGRRRRRPVDPFSAILPTSDGTGATTTTNNGAVSASAQRKHHSQVNDDGDVSVDESRLGNSLSDFSSKVDGTLHRARHLADQAEAAALHVPGGGTSSASAATCTSTAAQFLAGQHNRTDRIARRLEAVADALLQFPASGDEDGGSNIASLSELTRLCASVYEANAVQLAVVEDAMVHGGSGEIDESNDGMVQGRYDGMDARRAAIAAMERRQMTVAPDDYDGANAADASHATANAANVTDDASTIGSLGSLGTEELLTDGIIGDAVSSGTNSTRAPLGSISHNTALEGGASSTNHEDSAKISCHYNGLPLEAISEGEAESSSSGSSGSGSSSSGDTSTADNAGAATGGDEHPDAALVEEDIRSPSPVGLSMSAVMTPATPATPSLADLHLSQCTIDTLESAEEAIGDQNDTAARDDSRCSSDEEELCMATAPRRSDMEEFIGDGDSIGGSASLLNDSTYVQDSSTAEIVEVGTAFTEDTHVEDIGLSHPDDSSLEDDEDEDEDFSMAATIERNPVFEETLMHDGCSVATASPTIVADRKLAQMMAQVAREASRGESAVDGTADDDDDALSEGSASSAFSNKDDDSTASESSIDRLIEESDQVSEANATVGEKEEILPVNGSGGQTKRRTPILDRYRVLRTNDGYKVSPKDAEAATSSPKVLPFGVCSEKGNADEQQNQNPTAAPQQIQPKSKPKRQPTYEEQGRTRKVYPRTPIPKSIPEEDEDDLSETEDELQVATATPPVKTQGFGQLRVNQEEEDVTSRRLSSSGGDVPFSPQATAIKPKANPMENATSSTTQAPSGACRTPLAAAWIEKNMPEEKERLLSILSPKAPSAPSPSSTVSTTGSHSSGTNRKSIGNVGVSANLIRHLTMDEYERAPRIVKSQVSLDEVGAAVTTLNTWCDSHGDPQRHPTEIKEDQAYGLLGDMFSRRKAKNICMSLCHWKRLLMRGSFEDDGGLTFEVVNL